MSDSLMLKLHAQCKIAFDFWKQDQFSVNSIAHYNYRSKRKDYRLALCNFFEPSWLIEYRSCVLQQKLTRNCFGALERQKILFPDERIPCQRALTTEQNDIRDMWANHFEALGTPTVSLNFDNKFANSISTHIQNIFQNCINDPTLALNEPLTYEEVAGVYSNLKPGVSGVSLDYEHVGYAGALLWRLLFHLY